MPVEIFELVIRANVSDQKEITANNKKKKKQKKRSEKEVDDQILSLLNRKNER